MAWVGRLLTPVLHSMQSLQLNVQGSWCETRTSWCRARPSRTGSCGTRASTPSSTITAISRPAALPCLALPCLRHAGWHSYTCGFQVNHDRPKSSRFKGGSKPCLNSPHTRSPSVLLLPLHLCCCRYGALVQDGTRPGGAIEARAILCCIVWGSIYMQGSS